MRITAQTSLILGGAFLVSLAGLTMFRLWYFGYPLPNTFYAKVSPSLVYNVSVGIKYLKHFMFSNAIIPYCVAIVTVVVFRQGVLFLGDVVARGKRKPWFDKPFPPVFWLSIVAAVLIAIPILEGGDHFALHRFYQPLYPVLCLSLLFLVVDFHADRVRLIREVVARRKLASAALFLGSIVFVWLGMRHGSSSQYYWFDRVSPLQVEYRIAEAGQKNGEILNAVFEMASEYPSIGVLTAGGIARSYKGPILDVMGLNSVEVAHAKGDRKGLKNHAAFNKEVFMRLKPDILLEKPPLYPVLENFSSRAFRGLYSDPDFTAGYMYGRLSLKDASHVEFIAFCSRSFVNEKLADTHIVFEETAKHDANGQWHPLESFSEVQSP